MVDIKTLEGGMLLERERGNKTKKGKEERWEYLWRDPRSNLEPPILIEPYPYRTFEILV